MVESLAARLLRLLSASPRADVAARVHSDDSGRAWLQANLINDWGQSVSARCSTIEEVDRAVQAVAALPRHGAVETSGSGEARASPPGVSP